MLPFVLQRPKIESADSNTCPVHLAPPFLQPWSVDPPKNPTGNKQPPD